MCAMKYEEGFDLLSEGGNTNQVKQGTRMYLISKRNSKYAKYISLSLVYGEYVESLVLDILPKLSNVDLSQYLLC